MSRYRNLLKLPAWQKRRLEVMEARKWMCEACCDEEKPLQVHHLNYEKGLMPWDYPDDWLEVLCEDCHRWREQFNFVFGRSLASTKECRELASFFFRHVKPHLELRYIRGAKYLHKLHKLNESLNRGEDVALHEIFVELKKKDLAYKAAMASQQPNFISLHTP